MTIATSVHEIKTLILSYHPAIAMETADEDRVGRLLREVGAELGMPVFEWAVTRGLTRMPGGGRIHGTQEPVGVLRHLGSLTIDGLFWLKDFADHLKDPVTARQFRELCQGFAQSRSTLLLTGNRVDLPEGLEQSVVFYNLRFPSRLELREVMESVLHSLRAKHKFRMDLRHGDLNDLLKSLEGMTLNQARQALAYAIIEDGVLGSDDIAKIKAKKAEAIRQAGLLEYYPVEDNRFQLGGFENLQRWLERARLGFSAEAERLNLTPPKGVLIVGVQGCGKSLAAKVIARQWRMPLLKLEAGRLYDKYVGESEKNFRRAVAMAESLAPVVLWIDEIEKGFSTDSGSDGGLSQRLLGALLTWLQEKRRDVFVAATANNISALPPELLRKGRFDEIFFVDLPQPGERESIFRIHLALRKQAPEQFDLAALVAGSEGFSGAEIEQAVIGALYRCLHAGKPLSTDLLLQELSETSPLSHSRREDIEWLRQQARDRFVSVHG